MKKLKLSQLGEAICLSIGDKRVVRFWMSTDGAQHLSNRLQSFAKSQHAGIETVLIEDDQ